MNWIQLDALLRGTNVDPQAFANTCRMVIVCDNGAAQAGGACWFGTFETSDIDAAFCDYIREDNLTPEEIGERELDFYGPTG